MRWAPEPKLLRGEVFMSLVDRARNMIVRPAAEWPVVAVEPATPASLYTGYIIPLAAISAVCTFVEYALFVHHAVVIGAIVAAVSFVLELVYVFLVALLAQMLAPSFGGASDPLAALKWIAYAYTPRWVAGVALLVPFLGPLVVLVASLYSLYVLYLGAMPLMRVPQEKAIGYVAVLIVCIIVIAIVISVVLGILGAAAFVSAGAAAGAFAH